MKKIFNIECKSLINKKVKLYGFVENIRDHGKLIFLDLRDRSGLVQLVISLENKFFEMVKNIKTESVIAVEGTVKERPAHLINPNMETGKIEIEIE